MIPSRRVVVTGVGVVNAALTGSSAALGAYLASPRRAGGPVSAGALGGLIDEGEARRLSRVSQLTVAAARLAVGDAGCRPGPDLGLVVGTEYGDLRATMDFADGFLARGPAGLSPLLFPNTVMNTMASATAIALLVRGLSLTLNVPDLAGELAVRRGAAAVAAGRAEAVLAGGVDELDPRVADVLASLGGAEEVRGEGATFVVLESLAAAEARGARVLGEILGAASAALAARPHGVGRRVVSRAVSGALAQAGVSAGDVGWIYGSARGDRERAAWERAVLRAALAPLRPPSTSLGALVGHHSALGVMQVAAAAWTARTGLLPVPGGAPGKRAAPVTRVERVRPGPGLVHGVARGGTHVALVIGPPPHTSTRVNGA